jgi:hypothetical protein
MRKSNFVQCYSLQHLTIQALFVFEMPGVEISGFFSLAKYFNILFCIFLYS